MRGERQEIARDNLIKLNKESLLNFDQINFERDTANRLKVLNNFWAQQEAKDKQDWPWRGVDEELNITLDQACNWLYEHLFDYQEFNTLARKCRQEACSLNELAQEIFTTTSEHDPDLAQKFISVLLSIAPLARNKQNSVLFPARMHMLFRGLKGIYCCTNKNCPGYKETGGQNLGAIFFDERYYTCPYCNSVVRELVRDRRCGALFLKGFIDKSKGLSDGAYLWRSPNVVLSKSLAQVHLYIPSESGSDFRELCRNNNYSLCYLNSSSGYLFFDDSHLGEDGYLTLFYQNPDSMHIDDNEHAEKNLFTFNSCPHCTHRLDKSPLLNFNTKGNNSFFNLIKTQFGAQPPVAGKTILEQGEPIRYPNEGRKILIFSDSRQRAAKLARDMSVTSEDTACRQIMGLALTHMANQPKEIPTAQYLFNFFALHAAQQGCPIFQSSLNNDDDSSKFNELSHKILKQVTSIEPDSTNDQSEDLISLLSTPTQTSETKIAKLSTTELLTKEIDGNTLSQEKATDGFCEQLLKCYCQGANNLCDCAISYLIPSPKALKEVATESIKQAKQCQLNEEIKQLIAGSESISIELINKFFTELCSAWIQYLCVDHLALDPDISIEIRNKLSSFHLKDGLGTASVKLNPTIKKVLNISPELTICLETALIKVLLASGSNNKYLKLDQLVAHIDSPDHIWYRCDKCSQISPYMLKGHCPHCSSEHIKAMSEEDKKSLSFWRNPILEAIAGKRVYVIDTQEHTAQLQYKDQQNEPLSKTEQYEMRFQDFLNEGETPVDILSSTTTMEVGIDIGSLVSVGLRNIPPMRENYQQRAGRVGRRGASLSTIVTFCEDGPHDSIYFNDPRPMFRGEPRKPWIDIRSSKILERHLNLIILERFINELNNTLDKEEKKACLISNKTDLSLDTFATKAFIEGYQERLAQFAYHKFTVEDILLPQGANIDTNKIVDNLLAGIKSLASKVEQHPELYEVDLGTKAIKKKELLASLYEDGLIPSYSFPKNVVTTYICNSKGELEYEVQRGLDVAMSEYAPGRAIVVDKKTYQIGGIYTYFKSRTKSYIKDPARKFIEDPNYNKQVYKCPECQWFGTELHRGKCPFCNSSDVFKLAPMLRPWGFAPVNGRSTNVAKLEEDYSFAHKPQYSTVPNAEDMEPCPGYQRVQVAKRTDQNIIMLNEGPENKGFNVCIKCGASQPAHSNKRIRAPYVSDTECIHDFQHFNLGYDFKTDMLVVQFSIAGEDIDTTYWLNSAGQSLAEAIRLGASKLLDIEFNELVTGYRIRHNGNNYFVDIFVYDSLSSGAGYTTQLQSLLTELFDITRKLLSECKCYSACYDCIKHYFNQFEHATLDRIFALELLDYGKSGLCLNELSPQRQQKLLKPLSLMLNQDNCQLDLNTQILTKGQSHYKVVVFPAMLNKKSPLAHHGSDSHMKYIFLSELDLKHALPNAYKALIDQLI